MQSILRTGVVFLIAVAVTALLGVAASTHFVLEGLADVGAEIETSERISMTLYDIVHMGPLYGALVAAGFFIAFGAAALLARLASVYGGFLQVVDYTVAGAVALFAILTLLGMLMDIQLVAGARTDAGFWAQVACGAVGGFLFGAFSGPRRGAS